MRKFEQTELTSHILMDLEIALDNYKKLLWWKQVENTKNLIEHIRKNKLDIRLVSREE